MEKLGELEYQTSLKNPVQPASSEGTKIEQARTFAEVSMQVDLAKKYPRELDKVFQKIEETFQRSPGLLLKTKWSLPRGGERITGFTIQFARAVAECVGNIKYSFRELSREHKQSEMMVYAWDMESNTIQDRTFIVPHTKDLKGGRTKPLLHERDIYENNANMAARRLRECILDVLPAAARRYAEEVVENLLKSAFPDQKLQEYAEKAIKKFGEWGIKREQVIKERGNRPPQTWTRNDILALSSYVEDVENGDKKVEEIFGTFPKNVDIPKSPKKSKKSNLKDKPTDRKPDISEDTLKQAKETVKKEDDTKEFFDKQFDDLAEPNFGE